MPNKLDLIGHVFGRLTVVDEVPERTKYGQIKMVCICECGKITSVRKSDLRGGATSSCGCYQKQANVERNTTHGLSRGSLYYIWSGIKKRCCNPTHHNYASYGGRGITVCERWLESFENFLEDMGEGYKKGLQIDRRDNDGNYEPSNCRWTTPQQNAQNRGSRKGGSSKYKGVSWNKVQCKWQVSIKKDNKAKCLGTFTDEADAALAYNEAAKELFGEYANLNKIETN